MEVTAKELKQRLGKYLAAARSGECVSVTHRGKVVAQLTAPEKPEWQVRWDRLIAEGVLHPGKRGPFPPARKFKFERSPSEIIREDRDSEPDFIRGDLDHGAG